MRLRLGWSQAVRVEAGVAGSPLILEGLTKQSFEIDVSGSKPIAECSSAGVRNPPAPFFKSWLNRLNDALIRR